MTRFVLVTGDKGGVGKSFSARALMDWYQQTNATIHAFDTDKTNSTLYRFYGAGGKVGLLDVDQPAELDGLLDLLAREATSSGDSVVLVDCAARTLDTFIKWMQDVDFLSHKETVGFQFTIAFVLGPELDCVAILKDMVEHFRAAADYVVIKNLAKGTTFGTYDGSNTRKLLANDLKVTEITLPKLLEKTYLGIDNKNLPFDLAVDHPDLELSDRSRLRVFRTRVAESFEEARSKWT